MILTVKEILKSISILLIKILVLITINRFENKCLNRKKKPKNDRYIYIYISLHVKDSVYLCVIAALKFFSFVIVNVSVTIMQFSSKFGIYEMSENI